MAVFSNNFSIQWHNIQLHGIRSTGLVSLENAKSQCEFVTLNSHRPSNDHDVNFLSAQTTLQKIANTHFA